MSETAPLAPPHEKEIIAWLKNTVIPLQHIEANNGFADLQSLKTILQDVKIVGLGENTHGTHEIFQLKLRLVEFLVTEMGFNVFAIEASFAACQPINDYVLYGKGNCLEVLSGQGYVVWDTEEMVATLNWLRTHNQTVPDEKRVKFYGIDIKHNEYGKKSVLNYLHKIASERLATIAALFESLNKEEAKLRIDPDAEKSLAQLLPQFESAIDHLITNMKTFVGRSSQAEFDQALHLIRVMKQWIIANTAELRPISISGWTSRSQSMAENLFFLAEQESPGSKFIVSAYNAHISLEDVDSGKPNFGNILREKFGLSYFAFGFEFYQGVYQARQLLANRLLGNFIKGTIPPAAEGSVAWYLMQLNLHALLIHLHAPVDNRAVEQWLKTPQIFYEAGGTYTDGMDFTVKINIIDTYDGIIFVRDTTPSHPTAYALKMVTDQGRGDGCYSA